MIATVGADVGSVGVMIVTVGADVGVGGVMGSPVGIKVGVCSEASLDGTRFDVLRGVGVCLFFDTSFLGTEGVE